nr:hypothetical protein [Snodgrassella alvi]
MLALYPFALHHPYWICVQVILIGMSNNVGSLLQILLMDVAKDAQTLAAALNHSAFNAANALVSARQSVNALNFLLLLVIKLSIAA